MYEYFKQHDFITHKYERMSCRLSHIVMDKEDSIFIDNENISISISPLTGKWHDSLSLYENRKKYNG